MTRGDARVKAESRATTGSRDDWRPTASIPTLELRAEMLARARRYFAASGALEVDTPALVRAPVTDVHLETLRVVADAADGDATTVGFLQTSPEYAMKRLLCAGAPDIYQVCHAFRGGERGRRHNPEFSMIEWYRHGCDHHALMRDVEALVRALLDGRRRVEPSVHVRYREAFEHSLHVDPLHASIDAMVHALERAGVALPESMRADPQHGDVLDLAMSNVVAESFADDRLTFVYDFPASQAALARIEGETAARFEAFWGPLELANGFHELGSATEQRARFEADLDERRERARPRRQIDERLLAALAAGLPPCSGVALGFDRLMMVAMNTARIDEVMPFPYERA